MRRFNSAYGHRQILWTFAGVPDRPIFGLLQHGWSLSPGAGNGATGDSTYFRALPRLFWSVRQRDDARLAGIPNAHSVGAPFLYLCRLLDLELPRPPSPSRSVLFYTPHNWELSEDADSGGAVSAVQEAVANGHRVTVSVHPVDFARPGVVEAYRRTGARVVTNGANRYDPAFLYRQLSSLIRHDEVVSYQMGTAALYAAHLNRRVAFLAPSQKFTERTPYPNRTAFLGRSDVFTLMMDCDNFKQFAEAELGSDCLLSPEDLKIALGATPAHRLAANAISTATAVRRIARHRILGVAEAGI